MKQVKYIFVNEKDSQDAARIIRNSNVRDFRYNIVCDAKSKTELIKQLVDLRRHYPSAKILGISEIDGKNIRPSETMNQLRRELSDLL